MRLLLAKDSKKVRGMIFRDVQRTTMESFFRSIGDLRNTDLRNKLVSLEIPTLGIYGVKDNIVSPSNAQLLQANVRTSKVSMLQRSRHFPMTDEPDLFLETVSNFLNNGHHS
ncbi:MAG: alpha/beta hydrolase [Anaerolineae bacterium]|nr:alpha/beta hydrolase [Anaerolineae bacterium]